LFFFCSRARAAAKAEEQVGDGRDVCVRAEVEGARARGEVVVVALSSFSRKLFAWKWANAGRIEEDRLECERVLELVGVVGLCERATERVRERA
jgi:hypothetical protein